MRYFAHLSFKGTNYHGWQKQKNANTVQAEIEKALAIIYSKPVDIVGAGRTDTGVHARMMVIHFEVEEIADESKFLSIINSILPKDIAFQSVQKVKYDFHARFSATRRSYEYVINRQKDPFHEGQSVFMRYDLNVEEMNRASKHLIGKHDFSCFSKSNTQTFTNNCDISEAQWIEKEDRILVFQISADRFLRNMVRAIVGTMLEIGQGKKASDFIPDLILSKDRRQAGYSVPAEGLFLTDIQYPADGFI